MSTQSGWYQDEDQLLGALRQVRPPARPTPTIPGYDDVRELRRGGQGIVFSATQRSTRRRVAIKVLLDGAWAAESRRRRFEREIDLIATLHHPNIVRLYDSGVTEAGYPYYVMEYLEGVGLDELIGNEAHAWSRTRSSEPLDVHTVPPTTAPPLFSVRATLQLFVKVCDAVNYAHQRGVIHRDLKPSNIRIDSGGEPYVLDFGLAKIASDSYISSAQAPMSLTGEFMGSPPWASPEQADGSTHSTDVRTDVYALGVVLFQLLTHKFPYPVFGGLREVLENIRSADPLRPSSLRKELDDEIDTIVLKCLAKEPDRRYQTAGELVRDLRHYLANEPIEAKRDSALYTLRRAMRRYKYAARAATAVLLLTLCATVLLWILWIRAQAAEQLAAQRLEVTQHARAAEVVARDRAEQARAAEAVARDRAEKESEQSRAINQFLIKMLTSPLDLGREARVADVLDKAAAELPQSGALAPAIEAALREALGNAYASLGLYKEADPQLQRAVALWRGVQGDDGPETMDSLANVAWLLRQTGRLDESETLFRQVLAARRRVLGEDHINTTRTMNDLAYVLEMQGNLKEAEELHRKALASVRRLLGNEALDTLTSMGNLASVLCTAGQLDEAGGLLRERLDIARRVLGKNHRDTLRALSSYVRWLGLVGRIAEALPLSQEVYEGDRRLLGADHPETIVALANRAHALSDAGRLEEAEPPLREVLERARRILGPLHPDTLSALTNLAELLKNRGQYAEAETLLREALDGTRQTSGENHVDTLYVMNTLAQCLQVQNKREAAEELDRAALSGCLRTLGEENPYTLTVMINLATVLVDGREFDEAETLIRRALEIRQRLFGDEHIDTLHARLQLGILLHERGDFAAAAAQLAPLLETAQRVMPAEHWYPAVVEGWYGRALLGLQRYEDAEQHLVAAYERLRAILGEEHPRTQKMRQRAAELYTAWGKPDLAARYQAEPPTSQP
jgi:eukaryotic-like serine/threonine-protein kinase